jgi:hypothetical protein
MRMRPTIGIALVVLLTIAGGADAQIVPGRMGPAAPPPQIKADKLTMPTDETGATLRKSGKKIGHSNCAITSKAENCVSLGGAIIGGNTQSGLQYTFVGAILYNGYDGNRYICTGTLLSPTLVLTAGHCACGVPGTYWVNFNQDARQLPSNDVGLGAVDGAPIPFDSRLCRTGGLGGGRDLALLRLRNPYVPASPDTAFKLQPFPDPPELYWDLRDRLSVGRQMVAVGYGYSSAGTAGIRLQGSIPIASAGCEEAAYQSTCASFSEMMLADTPGPRARTDTCGGDSGGPVFLIEGKEPKLIAVTSRAAPGVNDNALHCGGGGIYALIGRKTVHSWLLAHGVARKPPQQSPKQ